MPRINLLPWRDEERKERKLKFLVALGGSAIAACLVAFVGYLMMDSMVSAQDARNDEAQGRNRRARQADREDQQPRGRQGALHRAHGSHREAAALASGNRAHLRRDRQAAAGRRLSHRASRRTARACSSKASRSRRPACPRSCATSTAPAISRIPSSKSSRPTSDKNVVGAAFVLYADQAGSAAENRKPRRTNPSGASRRGG